MTGDELKTLRESARLTQQELGQQIGARPSSAKQRIYAYETSRRGITPAMALLFRSLLEGSGA